MKIEEILEKVDEGTILEINQGEKIKGDIQKEERREIEN